MNRADLRWALDAVLPHAGKTADTAFVGLSQDREDYTLNAYATDRYTFGIANIDDGPPIDVKLPVSEAKDLLRFVRPTLKAHETEEVVALVHLNEGVAELHVGLVNADGETYDTAVFETTQAPVSIGYLLEFTERIRNSQPEYGPSIYWPRLFGRFSKAERYETDRLTIVPRRTGERHGAAAVTVGEHFIGAIAGMTYEPVQQEEDAA